LDLKQNPFSLYDSLGYFTPGALFVYGLMAAYAHVQPGGNSLQFIATRLSFDSAEIYIPFILASYAVGHFLSFVSSITVERYSIWVFGYPSKSLLGLPNSGYWAVSEKKFQRRAMRFLVGLLLAPITFLDWLLGSCAGLRDVYVKKLDPLLISAISLKIKRLVRDHALLPDADELGKPVEHDFFRYVYHYAVENAPSHLPKMQNYVALYGFLRTLTLLAIVFFWGTVWHTTRGVFSVTEAIVLLPSTLVVTYVLYMGFIKFYRRFSLEALMAMTVTYKN
jgi:hypothetical protein